MHCSKSYQFCIHSDNKHYRIDHLRKLVKVGVGTENIMEPELEEGEEVKQEILQALGK
jgi:hypothetical protein